MKKHGTPARLLVTGFGPYPGVPANPTGVLAHRVAASPRLRRAGIAATARVFETTYAGIGKALAKALDRLEPDICLHLGLAPRARRVRIEVRAENRTRPLSPDASGSRPRGRMLVAEGPGEWRTAVAVSPLVTALCRAGVPAATSRDAGAYLCNAVYALSLHAARARDDRLVVFVHIPWPAPSPGRMPSRRVTPRTWHRPRMGRPTAALCELAIQLAVQARSRALRPADRRA